MFIKRSSRSIFSCSHATFHVLTRHPFVLELFLVPSLFQISRVPLKSDEFFRIQHREFPIPNLFQVGDCGQFRRTLAVQQIPPKRLCCGYSLRWGYLPPRGFQGSINLNNFLWLCVVVTNPKHTYCYKEKNRPYQTTHFVHSDF